MFPRSSWILRSAPRILINTTIQRDFRCSSVALKGKSASKKQVTPTKLTTKTIKVKSTTSTKSDSTPILAAPDSAFSATPFATSKPATTSVPEKSKPVAAPNVEPSSTVASSSKSKDFEKTNTPATSAKTAETITSATLDKVSEPVKPTPITEPSISVSAKVEAPKILESAESEPLLNPVLATPKPKSEPIEHTDPIFKNAEFLNEHAVLSTPVISEATGGSENSSLPETTETKSDDVTVVEATIPAPPVKPEAVDELETTSVLKVTAEPIVSNETPSPSTEKSFEDPSNTSSADVQEPVLSEKETISEAISDPVEIEQPAIDPIQKLFADKVMD